MHLPSQMDPNPWVQFQKWYTDAVQAKIQNPEAMTLATANLKGIPSARIMLFKGVELGGLTFYTNYRSRKSKELESNPRAAVIFYWPALNRQLRIEGKIKKVPPSNSDEYWNTRPRESRLNALISPQSSLISGRKELEEKLEIITEKFQNKEIPRPAHWGGYVLIPHRFEFWLADPYRLHDRFCYVQKLKKWRIVQLAP